MSKWYKKEDALRDCARLWHWIGLDDDNAKCEWPEWERNGGSVPDIPADCSCCAYSDQFSHSKREKNDDGEELCHCPIPIGRESTGGAYDCLGGLFIEWSHYSNSENAWAIRDLALAELEDMGVGKEEVLK